MRAVLHIAGRPDPDGIQRCVICRHNLAGQMQAGKFPMGRDVAQIMTNGSTLRYEQGEGPAETLVVRCSAI